MTKIGMASIDENGKIYGGKAGDQTGAEVKICNWYNKPWDCIIRPKDNSVALLMGMDMVNACENNKIGYDQWQREDLIKELKKVNWDFYKVSGATETDCSALVAAIVAKYYGEDAMRNKNRGNKLAYTGDLKALCIATGKFDILTDSKYLTSPDWLKPGDILLNEKKHAAMCIEYGAKAAPNANQNPVPTSTTLKKGSKGEAVKTLQTNLNKVMNSGLVVDGDFGPITDAAVREFQKKYNLVVDGEYGPISDAKMKEILTPVVKKGVVTARSGLNVRKGPGTNYSVVKVLSLGTQITILSESNGWIKIAEGQYVSATYINKV